MTIASIEVNENVYQRFVVFHQKQRLAHAYLFVGHQDIGKTQTALAITKYINCENQQVPKSDKYCDTCPTCRQIQAGNHPDIRIIEGLEGESIKIEQIRDLISQAQLRPYSALKKVYILRNVENLTPEGSNSLLKTLEEPSANSLYLLTTSSPERLLSTLRSRCHAVHFLPLGKRVLKDRLGRYNDENASEFPFISYFSQGYFSKAAKLSEESIIREKNLYIDRFIFSHSADDFIKDIVGDKDKLREFFDILLTWQRDALLIKVNLEEEKIIHMDRLKELNEYSKEHSFTQLMDITNEVIYCSKMTRENFNVKLALLILKEKLKNG